MRANSLWTIWLLQLLRALELGDEGGLAVSLELLVGDGSTHVALRLTNHDGAHAPGLSDGHSSLACCRVLVLDLLVLLHELLLVIQVGLVVHVHGSLSMLARHQCALLTELRQLGVRVCYRCITSPIWSQLR